MYPWHKNGKGNHGRHSCQTKKAAIMHEAPLHPAPPSQTLKPCSKAAHLVAQSRHSVEKTDVQEIDMQQEERDNRAARTPVDRLVLVCHGIGQAMTASNIAKDAGCFRGVLQQMSQVRRLCGPGGVEVYCLAGSLSALHPPYGACYWRSLGAFKKCHAPDLPAPDMYTMFLAHAWLMALIPFGAGGPGRGPAEQGPG